MTRSAQHEVSMQMALNLARKGLGFTSPNPVVGSVIVDAAGAIVGMGYHAKAGMAHAEVVALKDAGEKARGATLYVTLEPCCVQGRTPPCTDAIIRAGIQKVVYAAQDPNPAVAGRSRAILEAAGIAVESGILEPEARYLNRHFNKHITRQMPYITLKSAITLDGKTAVANGQSRWITGEGARQDGHFLRGIHDAIAVGIGTIIADDPLLTCRHGGKTALPHPDVVIFDTFLRTPRNAAVLRPSEAERRVIIVTSSTMMESDTATRLLGAGIQLIGLPPASQGLPLQQAFAALYEQYGITSVLVEGGAGLTSAIIKETLEDEHVIYMAPKLFGDEGMTWSGSLKVPTPDKAYQLRLHSVERLGNDIRICAHRREHGNL